MSFELYITQQIINAVILRMTNFAHGDMMMVGGFSTLVLQNLGLGFGWAVVGGIGVGALAGVIVERTAYRPVRGAPEVTLLLTSLAVTYILENLGILIFTSSAQNFPLPDWMDSAFQLYNGQITFTQINLLTVALTGVALTALGWFVT